LFTGIQNHGHEHGVALPDQEEKKGTSESEGGEKRGKWDYEKVKGKRAIQNARTPF
jgi:hypothetical protein